MTAEEKKFCILLLINTVVAIVYVIGYCLVRREEKKTDILMNMIGDHPTRRSLSRGWNN